MGASTTAKRGDARRVGSPPSHIRREIVAVVLITLGLLLLLSLLSYIPGDRPSNNGTSVGPSAASPSKNLIGTVGAATASTLFWLIGAGAYVLPLFLIHVGIRCFMQGHVTVPLKTALYSTVALFSLSGFLHLELPGIPTLVGGVVQRGLSGGVIGQGLASFLKAYFASTGAHIILFSILLVTLLLSTSTSLAHLMDRLSGWMERGQELQSAIRDWLEERLEQRSKRNRRAKSKPPKINRSTAGITAPTEEESDQEEDEEVLAQSLPAPVVRTVQPAPTEDPVEPLQPAPSAVRSDYRLPDPRELLDDPQQPAARMTDQELKAQSEVLAKALLSFGIEGKVTEVHPGPVVTMYEYEPAPGVKVSRIVNLADDLALAMKAMSLRIVAPLPGKSVVGIEVPNRQRETVSFKEVIMSEAVTRSRSKLTMALGKDIFGTPVAADLRTMPHVLVAGATGAGKSVSLNTMLLSILFNARPDEVKLLLIDPKMLELQTYDGIPHLLRPVITDPKSAARGLGWVVQEMERRYKLLAEAGVRNIEGYNRWVHREQGGTGEADKGTPEQPELPIFLSEEERLSAGESDQPPLPTGELGPQPKTPPAPLPYIVVMIDELADLMMVAPKDVEEKIARLAQMARAAGIHLVLATQRPSVDVLTGLIKANFPARIAFQVASKTDSRTILDANGAEALLGRGDMLYMASGTGRLMRIHGSFVADEDVRRVVGVIKKQAAPSYASPEQFQRQEEAAEEEAKDEVYEQAKELVISTGQASASLIQRRLRVGYPRAARMVEQMESEGIVGAAGRDGRREVLGRRGPVGQAHGE
jgi:S-DNA-T family DNA segregation ATPase FtsK/SpoIIIE